MFERFNHPQNPQPASLADVLNAGHMELLDFDPATHQGHVVMPLIGGMFARFVVSDGTVAPDGSHTWHFFLDGIEPASEQKEA